MPNRVFEQRRRERPIYYYLKEEIGNALSIDVGILTLEKKSISQGTMISPKSRSSGLSLRWGTLPG